MADVSDNRFAKLFRRQDRTGAFIPFFMLGDPTPEKSVRLIRAAVAAGADALELGIPFSDPIADGPVIQASAIRAAKAGATVDRCLEMIAELRSATELPIGLLLYYNLVCRRGLDVFCRDSAAAGVDALLAADLPYDRGDRFSGAVADHGMGSVFLVSQNTPDDRARAILQRSTAYAYAVGIMGTTGARENIADTTRGFVKRLRRLGDEPFVVGFGVGHPAQAVEILNLGADGVIVGSALIDRVASGLDDFDRVVAEVATFVRSVRSMKENQSCSS